MRSLFALRCLVALVFAFGCSAIIDPDEGSLGGPGSDGGVDAAIDAAIDTGDGTDAGIDAGERDAGFDANISCERDDECDDRNPCNGVETCGGGRCVSGDPLDCDDGVNCTGDSCDPGLGCVNEPIEGFCDDGVCFTGGVCDPTMGCVGGGDPTDCRDFDPCTTDMCDAAMGGCFNPPRDTDGDGYPAGSVGGTSCADGNDCDDTNPDIHPDAAEVCGDGLDNNCDGAIDEGCDDVPDDCGSAIGIPLSDGSGSVTGIIGDAGHDYETNCTNGRTGRDVVYYVDIPRTITMGTFDITVDTIGSDFDTVLAVSPDCGDWDYGGLGCNDDLNPGPELDSRVWVHRFDVPFGMTSRRLYILVDAFRNDASGSYQINVNVEGAAGDTCFGRRMSLAGGGSVIGFSGSAIGFGFTRGSCTPDGDSGAEVPFNFPGGAADFTVTSDSFNPTVFVRRACNDEDTESGCDVGGSIGGGLNEAFVEVDGGSVVFVDGLGAGDSFTLQYDPRGG